MQAPELIKRAEIAAAGTSALARALGVPQQHVSDWKGERRTCPPDMRARMADMCGLDPVAEALEALAEGLSEQRRAGLQKALAGRVLLKFYPMQHPGPARHALAMAASHLTQAALRWWPGCTPSAAPSPSA